MPLRVLALGSVIFSGASLAANDYAVKPADSDGYFIPGFYPNIEVGLGYDDNVLRTDSNRESSAYLQIKPELQWVGAIRTHSVRLGYQGDYTNYFSVSDDNYRDHAVVADVILDLSKKFDLKVGGYFKKEHEGRAQAGALNTGAEPNEFDEYGFYTEAVYGRRIANAQIGAKFDHVDREYTNNLGTGGATGQEVRDYDQDKLTLVAYYSLGPRTQLLIEPSIADVSYPNSNQDNTITKFLVGITWEATAKTTGKIKVGRYEKDYDDAALDDASGMSAEGSVVWSPKTYSRFQFKLARDGFDSNIGGVSSNYDSTLASVDWKHDLTGLNQLQAGLSLENDDYDSSPREDDTFTAYVGLSRAVTRTVTVGLRYDREQRDSSIAGLDYEDNRISLGMKTTFD